MVSYRRVETLDEADEHRRSANARGALAWVPRGLDNYEITALCCENQHTATFRGHLKDKGLGVLIKVSQASGDSGQGANRVYRDCEIAQALRSSCVAKVLAIERTESGPVFIYVDEGVEPLEGAATGGPLGVEAVLTIGSALAGALDELHKEHLVHGNLNTKSVWFCAPETIRIFDFWCARHPSPEFASGSFDGLADIRYVAPEQTGRVHHTVDHRTDIYAIGVILFRLLGGELPFDGTDPLRIADAQLTIEPSFSTEVANRSPPPLVKLILKCLAKDPAARYSSSSGLEADLRKCLSEWRLKGSIGEFELGGQDATGVLQIPSKLYCRDYESGILREFVRKSHRSQPAVLLVRGSAGVGKSAFLNQLGGFVRKEFGRLVSAKFDQFKRNVPHLSLIQAFQQLVDQLLAEPDDQLVVWRSRILAAAENCAQIIIEVIPEMELVTGPQPALPKLPPNESRNRFNRIFANVIQAFARPDNPLCLFMDDLQWSDTASLELLRHVLTDRDTSNFLFVGSYRSGEVGPSHLLQRTIHSLENAAIDLQAVDLRALRIEDVVPLVRETLSPCATEPLQLAGLLHSRTQGNPLYLTQLLHLLYDKGLVAFDYSTGAWRWDIRRIQAEAVTKDILDLLDIRMRTLPAATTRVLSTAACIGGIFDAAKIAVAAAQLDALQRILECVAADLLVPAEDFANDAAGIGHPSHGRFRFLHDRIQQAAFDLIPPEEKKAFRAGIGRRLLETFSPEEKTVPQIDVLNNLNYAWELIVDKEEKRELARMNLIAGCKARNSLAYEDALRYMSVGLNLLEENAWQTCYDLAFDLHVNALECEYLTGAFAHAEELFALLIDKSRSTLDKAKVYLTKILLDTSEEHYEEAIRVGIEALRLFGIRCVRTPTVADLAWELLLARARMRGRRAGDLLQAPALVDSNKLAGLRMLVALFPTAYFLSPKLLMFTGMKVVNYSLREGISSLAATGFVIYGLGLGAALDQHKAGYEFGKFAVELAEQGQDGTVICKVLVIFAQFIKLWRDPIDESFALIERARRLALQVGDHQYVNYAIIGEISLHFSQGMALPDFIALCCRHESFVMASKDAFPTDSFLMWKSCALALLGETEAYCSLSHRWYDEHAAEERYRTTGNLTLLSYQFTLRLQLLYLFGRYEEAFALSRMGDAVINSAPGYITVADHYLYCGLAAARLLGRSPRARHLKLAVQRCLKRLALFTKNCPRNFLPYLVLLRAESARASGDSAMASKLYNEAVELADQRNLPQLVGIANERAAVCCLADGQRRLAAWYLAAARAAYAQWGAAAKVAALDREFEGVRSADPPAPVSEPALVAANAQRQSEVPFDVAAAAAATLAIRLGGRDRALVNLMQIIRAHAGAETARLIVSRAGMHRVEASAVVGSSRGQANENDGFSRSIVNYVVHTHKDLIVDYPHLDPRFSRCDYLLQHGPKSVMCAAIARGDELLGVIYVEHRGIAGAFDQQKLWCLRILATEVGWTVSNDKLIRYKDYLRRFAPTIAAKEIDADPDSPNLALQQQDISVLFADVAGYTRMSEFMEQHHIDELVNRAFAEFVDDIHRLHGVLLRVRGDELFAIFQDEDVRRHARNAAGAALSIVRTAGRLSENRLTNEPPIIVNIGINSGPAAVGLQPIEAASGANWRYDATGATVNLAARAREFARDGSIVVSAAAADRIKDDYELVGLGEHLFKNISNPIRLFRLSGVVGARE